MNPKAENGAPISSSFLHTNCEFLRGGELQHRAHTRVRSLRPELEPIVCRIEVGMLPKTTVIIVRALGEEPVYVQTFLNAILQEFLAYRKELQARTAMLRTDAIQTEIVRLEKELESSSRRSPKAVPIDSQGRTVETEQLRVAYLEWTGKLRELDRERVESVEPFSVLETASVGIRVSAKYPLLDVFFRKPQPAEK